MKSGEKYEEVELVKKDENDEKSSDGEDPEIELMKKREHDVKQTDGEDDEMELVEKDENGHDGEDPETELMKKSQHDVKQTDGEDDEELVPLRKLVNDLESRVEVAKSALALIKRIDNVPNEVPIATTILPIKASFGDESTTDVPYLKNKEGSLRAEYTFLIAELRRELENIDLLVSAATQNEEETHMSELEGNKLPDDLQNQMEDTFEQLQYKEMILNQTQEKLGETVEALEKQTKENIHLRCTLVAQDLKEKELSKISEELKKHKEIMFEQLKCKENIIKEKEEKLKQGANQETVMLSTLHDKEKTIKILNEELRQLDVALKKHVMKNTKLLEQQAAQDLKEKDQETFIQKLNEELTKLDKVLENHQAENANLSKELAAKDKILKEHEEALPKIIQNSPLQCVYNSIPKCMRTCLAPKGSITGEELGTFMGSLVTTTAYNVTVSNSDLQGFLILNSLANLMGSIFGQICNNIVTHISHMEMGRNWAKEAFKLSLKSVFWVFLGGLIPMLAGGFITKYWLRLVVTAASALALQCGTATLWKKSYKISMWQPMVIVVLGIIGIGIAAGIPHFIKVVSEEKEKKCCTC